MCTFEGGLLVGGLEGKRGMCLGWLVCINMGVLRGCVWYVDVILVVYVVYGINMS